MTDPAQPPSPGRPAELLAAGDREGAAACLGRLDDADARKRALRELRNLAEERPEAFGDFAGTLATFLDDEERAVRLTTAKLFVALAQSVPDVVLPAVESLADRLADDGEFYYVRGRCAEALGYVTLEAPGAVEDPAVLADLRVGLSFDEPEVREKLAKGLACVALGDPDRLRHLVPSLAEHLDDDRVLVRYHLCTALAAVGCEHPENLSEAAAPLRARLADESPYVQGRAVEAVALLARSGAPADPVPGLGGVADDDAPPFLTDRVRFARASLGDDTGRTPDGVGTVESIRRGTDEAVAAIRSTDGDGECPHCGLELPDGAPPMCPRCGAPH
jgi:HEAT repeat protein